ncbi:lysozyme inhibitor LprI family protein [Cupriavidus pauculus]|uniref:lysozyme inhibitor LprI family protein n=1 Tax=Cupriavidus pauculus TaxID=82633 RepID=UPI001FD347A1|nr:lysozyme inhibitor LprI family protein [Cupriavidus pauculus]
MKLRLLSATALLCLSAVAHAASFDCKKAGTFVEKEICADASLSKLDDALTSNYRMMMASNLGDGGASLKKEQRAWLAKRNKCTTNKCLNDLYRERVDSVCEAPVVTGLHPICTEAGEIQ